MSVKMERISQCFERECKCAFIIFSKSQKKLQFSTDILRYQKCGSCGEIHKKDQKSAVE